MAAIIWTDVTAVAPALSTLAVGAQTDILAYVNEEALDSGCLGGDDGFTYRLARIYLAAHFGTISQAASLANGAEGVNSETSGGNSITYGNGNYERNYLVIGDRMASTPYGSAYLNLIRSSPYRGPLVI